MFPNKLVVLFGLFLALLPAGCAEMQKQSLPVNSKSTEEKEQVVEILGEMNWLPQHLKEEQFVFETQKQMMDGWTADGPEKFLNLWVPKDSKRGAADAKEIDFGKQMALAVFRGKATDHDGIQIERIVSKGGRVIVEYRKIGVAKGTAPMPAYPSHVVVINRVEGKFEFSLLPTAPRTLPPVP